jgi:hypothetical protein
LISDRIKYYICQIELNIESILKIHGIISMLSSKWLIIYNNRRIKQQFNYTPEPKKYFIIIFFIIAPKIFWNIIFIMKRVFTMSGIFLEHPKILSLVFQIKNFVKNYVII